MLKRDNLYLLRQKISGYLGDIESHVIDEHNVQYRYLESGDRNAPCILFLHGILGTKSQWRGLMEEFSITHRVISIDIPGLSVGIKSSNVGYDFSSLARYLHTFLIRIGVPSCSIVGHCVGGNLAQQYQSLYSNKVIDLVLVSPVGMELQDPKVMISKVSQFRKMLDFESFEEFNQLANNLFYQPIKVAKILLEFRMKDLIRNRSSVLLVIQELEKSLAATVQALALSQCRKLVICGDSDIYVDQQEFIFFDQCSHLQLEVFEQCGHVPFLEYPKKTDQLVRKFLLEKHTSRLDSY